MPERAEQIADNIKKHVKWPVDVIVVDNGSDKAPPAKSTAIKLEANVQVLLALPPQRDDQTCLVYLRGISLVMPALALLLPSRQKPMPLLAVLHRVGERD